MADTVATIAEGMSSGQAGNMADQLVTHCRKHGSTLPKDIVQQVLKQEGSDLAKEQFELLRARVESRKNMIVRHVIINPNLTPKQLIEATGRKQLVTADVLATMPKSIGPDEDDVYFFKVGRNLTPEELDKEYELRGLVPNPRKQAQVNIDDLLFADEYPNASQWNRDGKVASYLALSRWSDAGHVSCNRDGGERWSDHWWFAGVRK